MPEEITQPATEQPRQPVVESSQVRSTDLEGLDTETTTGRVEIPSRPVVYPDGGVLDTTVIFNGESTNGGEPALSLEIDSKYTSPNTSPPYSAEGGITITNDPSLTINGGGVLPITPESEAFINGEATFVPGAPVSASGEVGFRAGQEVPGASVNLETKLTDGTERPPAVEGVVTLETDGNAGPIRVQTTVEAGGQIDLNSGRSSGYVEAGAGLSGDVGIGTLGLEGSVRNETPEGTSGEVGPRFVSNPVSTGFAGDVQFSAEVNRIFPEGGTEGTISVQTVPGEPSTVTQDEIADRVDGEIQRYQLYQSQREVINEFIATDGVRDGLVNYRDFLDKAAISGVMEAAETMGLTRSDAISRLDQAVDRLPPAERAEAITGSGETALRETVNDLGKLNVDPDSSGRQSDTVAPSKELQPERLQEQKPELSPAF